jgi:hypothetical protein
MEPALPRFLSSFDKRPSGPDHPSKSVAIVRGGIKPALWFDIEANQNLLKVTWNTPFAIDNHSSRGINET